MVHVNFSKIVAFKRTIRKCLNVVPVSAHTVLKAKATVSPYMLILHILSCQCPFNSLHYLHFLNLFR
jgi:hypothetical protein